MRPCQLRGVGCWRGLERQAGEVAGDFGPGVGVWCDLGLSRPSGIVVSCGPRVLDWAW